MKNKKHFFTKCPERILSDFQMVLLQSYTNFLTCNTIRLQSLFKSLCEHDFIQGYGVTYSRANKLKHIGITDDKIVEFKNLDDIDAIACIEDIAFCLNDFMCSHMGKYNIYTIDSTRQLDNPSASI